MNARKVIRTELLDQQIDQQLEWYVENVDDPVIPVRFLNAIKESIKDIKFSPQTYPQYLASRVEFESLNDLDLRRKRIDSKFPFYIYYQFNDNTITLRFIYRSSRDVDNKIEDNNL